MFNKYIFFNFGRGFCSSLSVFPEALASDDEKNLEIIFTALYFYLYELKSVSQVFEILFETGDLISILLSFLVSFVQLRRYVQLRSSFSDEKNISDEAHFRNEAIKV